MFWSFIKSCFVIMFLFFVLVACTALFVGDEGDDTSDSKNSETNTGDNTEADASNTDDDASESNAEVESTNTMLAVGDSYTIDGITMTINSVYYTDERNQFHEEPVDNVLVMNVTYHNNSGDDASIGSSDFDVYADSNAMSTYPVSTMLDTISHGRTVTGDVAFGIVGQPQIIEAEWRPIFSWSDDRGLFNVTP